MELINEYWQIIVGLITLIIVLSKMHLDIEIIKDKVKTLFGMINKERDK
tara:strand:- start:898 stop:1044 length:147 start_codon:yes stop_codon:yes gene_type:complete